MNAWRIAAGGSLLALVLLCVAWETVLAPARPGAFLMAIKAMPAALALPGVWRGRVYTYQWSAMVIFLYFSEGVMRAYADAGLSATLAHLEWLLALAYLIAALGFVRTTRRKARLEAASRT